MTGITSILPVARTLEAKDQARNRASETPSTQQSDREAPEERLTISDRGDDPRETEQTQPIGFERDVSDIDRLRQEFGQKLEESQKDGLLRELKFDFEIEDEGTIVVKILDAKTDKVLRELPPEELRNLAERLEEYSGLVVDQTA